jgi:hypothetical protein
MGSFPFLGFDRDTWDLKNETDLIAIKPRAAPDIFSKWFTEGFVPYYHQIIGKKFKVIPSQYSLNQYVMQPDIEKPANIWPKEQLPETVGAGIYHYRESSLESALGIMATVVASVLPVCSVVALYIIQSNNLRLGMLAIFSALFSLTLTLMTNARRIEIFAATAA